MVGSTSTTVALTAEAGKTAKLTDTESAPAPRARGSIPGRGTSDSKFPASTLGPGRKRLQSLEV